MTTLTDGGNATLAEIASRVDATGAMRKYVNVLSKKNRMLDFLPWQECNMDDGHEVSRTDTSLAAADWRMHNQGVTASKSSTATYVESCGRLESETIIDEAEADRNGGAAWLASEADLKKEGIAQQYGTATLYESTSNNPERIHGLSARYSATSGVTASSYVLKGDNAGVNCKSVWLMTPELRKFYGIYRKGTKAGLQQRDNGRVRIQDTPTTAYWAYSITNIWEVGLAVEDYRMLVRGQFDPDDPVMVANEEGLMSLMDDMTHTVYEVSPMSFWVMNRDGIKLLNKQLRHSGQRLENQLRWNGQLVGDPSSMGGQGVWYPTYNNIPIVLSDLLVNETAIS